MQTKLVLGVFRFNSKTDYLPYYKKIVIKIDMEKTVADLLAVIKDDEKVFEYPKDKNAAIKVNTKALFTSEKLSTVVEEFGKELQLDPLNSKRAINDLLMNYDDFKNRFDVLDAYVDSNDRKLFNSYVREHYSSPIINLEEDYLGDGLFCFAYDMIQKYPDRKKDILNAISEQSTGIWLHVNISNKLFPENYELERKVDFLKNEMIKQVDSANSFVAKQKKLSSNF